jgi:hypothetical protein
MAGAIFTKNNILDVQNCQFVGNTAPSSGAMMVVESELKMADALFVANEATGLSPGFESIIDSLTGIVINITGGASGALKDYQTPLDEGIAGALYLVDTKTEIQDTRILDNIAKGVNSAGGGLAIKGGLSIVTHDLLNCLIAGNSSGNNGGGVMVMSSAEPRFVNCTIADNSAKSLGGGVFIDRTSGATFVNSIFAGNSRPISIQRKAAGRTQRIRYISEIHVCRRSAGQVLP